MTAQTAPYVALFYAVVAHAAEVVYKQREIRRSKEYSEAVDFLTTVAPEWCERLGGLPDGDAIRRWVENPQCIDGVTLRELSRLIGRSPAFVSHRVEDGSIDAVRDIFSQCGKRMVIPREYAERIVARGFFSVEVSNGTSKANYE